MSDIVGQIALELNLDSDNFKKSLKNLDKTAQASAESLKSSFSSAFKKVGTAIVAAFSVSAVVNFGEEAVEAAASVQAANSQLEQTFGSLQSNAEAAMQRVADSSGVLETRLQGVGTSIYAFAKTTGMDSTSALSMMEEALQVTADSAAYYDRSLEDTAESLKSFLKGNYENDAALGLSCTETTRNAAANKLYGKSFQDLSEAQKQLTLLQMVKDANELSGALGQASRESNNWENVIGNLQEAWNQFLAVVGQPILSAAVTVIQQITAAIQTLTSYAQQASQALAGLFGWSDTSGIASSVSSAAASAGTLSESAADTTDSMKDTEEEAEKLKKSLAGFDQLNILSESDSSDSSSETSAGTEQAAITPEVDTSSAEESIEKSLDGIKKKIDNIFKNSGISDFVEEIQKGVSQIDFAEIGNNFRSIMQSLKPIAQSSFNGLQKTAQSSMRTLGKIIGGVSSVVGKSVQTISGGVEKWLSEDKDKIAGYIDTISTNISSGIDNVGLFVDSVCTTAGNSIDRMRPTMENSIANMLGGITTFSGSVGTIFSEAFNTASEVIATWAEENKTLLGEFFDNIQTICADCMNGIGTVFEDVGNILTSWWDNGGSQMWESFCQVVSDLGTIFLEVFNDWIMPVWDAVCTACESAWNDCLAPVFQKIMDVLTKLWNDIIYPLWQNVLKPLVDWIVKELGPTFETVFGVIGNVFEDVFSTIGGLLSGLWDSLGGLIDFISGVFSGDLEKAWNGLADFFKGIWDGIWAVLKGIINIIIDALNLLWSGIYAVVKGIVDVVGGVSGAIGSIFGQDWSFSMPDCPTIPRLASGGLATAPTLALVGDNKNARSDPEVISPLSKLQGMLDSGGDNDAVLQLLRKIYDLLNGEETQYVNNTYLDSELIERQLVKVRKRKSRRYGGV